jgi:hypothetical protein
MQPDALGIAFGTGVLTGMILVFAILNWLITGAVSALRYSFGATMGRGLAAWSGHRSVDQDA